MYEVGSEERKEYLCAVNGGVGGVVTVATKSRPPFVMSRLVVTTRQEA